MVERFWDEAFGRPSQSRDVVSGDPPWGVFNAFVPHPITRWSPLLDATTWQATRRAEDDAAAVCTDNADSDGAARWMAVRLESSASSQIEGIRVSARHLARGEAQPERIAAKDRAVRAVIGNIAATEHALRLGSSAAPVTVDDICSIHRALMGDDPIAGRLRTEQNWIGTRYSTPPSAVFVPPPPQMVPELLDDVVASINETDVPAVVHAAVVHAQFEAIHPFGDGNGRTGRALMVLMLARSGLTKSSVLPISATLAQRQDPHVQTLNPDRSRELVSGSGLCFIVFFRVISGGGFGGWVVLGARVGVVRLVGAVLWRGSGCGGARGESFGGGWGRRAVAGVYGAPGLQACSSCAVAGHQSSRRRVHFLEERTIRAGACHSCHLRRLGAA